MIVGGVANVSIAYFVSYGFARVEAVLANNIIQLDIPITMLFAYLFYQEIPVFRELFGGGIILASVYYLNKIENKGEK